MNARPTESQIERDAESKMDALDFALSHGRLTQAEYDAKVVELDAWVDLQFQTLADAAQ